MIAPMTASYQMTPSPETIAAWYDMIKDVDPLHVRIAITAIMESTTALPYGASIAAMILAKLEGPIDLQISEAWDDVRKGRGGELARKVFKSIAGVQPGQQLEKDNQYLRRSFVAEYRAHLQRDKDRAVQRRVLALTGEEQKQIGGGNGAA